MTIETAEPAMSAAEPAAPPVTPPPKPQPSPELIGRLQALGIYPADGAAPAVRPPPASKPHLHHRTRWLIGLAVTVLLALAVSVVLLALAWPPFGAAVRQIIDIPRPVVDALAPLTNYLSVESTPAPMPPPAATAPPSPTPAPPSATAVTPPPAPGPAPGPLELAPAPAPLPPFLMPLERSGDTLGRAPVLQSPAAVATPLEPASPQFPASAPAALAVPPPPAATPTPAPQAAPLAAPVPTPDVQPSPPPSAAAPVPRAPYGWGYPSYYPPMPQGYYGAPPAR